MENIGEEAAAKFINALIKSVQTLCHGYLDFQTGIEIIGHINLSVDKGTSLDYILKEKVCKNAANSTLFVSDSFHAEPKPDHREAEKNSQSSNQVINHHNAVEPAESGVISCALDQTTVAQTVTGRRLRSSGTSGVKNSQTSKHTAKRKARSEDQCTDVIPAKMPSHVDSMSHFSDDSSFLTGPPSPLDSKEAVQALSVSATGVSELMPLQTPDMTTDRSADAFDSVAGSEQKASGDNDNLHEEYSDEEDLLNVTFVKAEHVGSEESEQSTGQQHGVRNSNLKDPQWRTHFTMLAEIRSDVADLKRLALAGSVPSSNRPSLPEGIKFPMETEETVSELEDKLQDSTCKDRMLNGSHLGQESNPMSELERRKESVVPAGGNETFITFLGTTGGDSAVDLLRRIMRRVMATTLCFQYNMTGRHKKSFNQLKLKSVVYAAVRKAFPNATESDLDSCLSRWLTCARDRDGGRSNRMPKKSNHNEREDESMLYEIENPDEYD